MGLSGAVVRISKIVRGEGTKRAYEGKVRGDRTRASTPGSTRVSTRVSKSVLYCVWFSPVGLSFFEISSCQITKSPNLTSQLSSRKTCQVLLFGQLITYRWQCSYSQNDQFRAPVSRLATARHDEFLDNRFQWKATVLHTADQNDRDTGHSHGCSLLFLQ